MEVNIEGLWSGSFVSYCIFMSLSLNRLFLKKEKKIWFLFKVLLWRCQMIAIMLKLLLTFLDVELSNVGVFLFISGLLVVNYRMSFKWFFCFLFLICVGTI